MAANTEEVASQGMSPSTTGSDPSGARTPEGSGTGTESELPAEVTVFDPRKSKDFKGGT